ncbi:MAG: zinc-binding alcohol dehydrogenase family protein [Flavobacteriales bacterium]|nr:zinc-binding alcohol dehydrogenase family protein [Flavobacteriales bacterium]
MKAIGFMTSLNIDEKDSFIEIEIDKPKPHGRNILVKVEAVSVNPVDFKVRANSAKNTVLERPKIIGWDAVGVVDEVGDEVVLFKKGDKVFYAGDITKPGSDSEFHIIDERIVGMSPKSISSEKAAAMPLTTLTAWEALFERLKLNIGENDNKSILIIGGAGGVGSIAIQLAKKIANLEVIATASRKETIDWCIEMGADVVVNHYNLVESVRNLAYKNVDYILNLADIDFHWEAICELIKPQGQICGIVENTKELNMDVLKLKSASYAWELMFTKSMFETEDMVEQHHILNSISTLMDEGKIISTHKNTINGFSVESFKEAHSLLESGKSIGKTVILF